MLFNILIWISDHGVIQVGEREQLSSWWSHRDRLSDPLIVFDILSVLSVVSQDDVSATCLASLPGLDGEPHPWYYQDLVGSWRLSSFHCHNAARNDFIHNILESINSSFTEIACIRDWDLSFWRRLAVLGDLPARSFANSPSYQNPNGYLGANFPQLRISQLWISNLLLLRTQVGCVGCNQRQEVTYYGKAESGSHHHLSDSGLGVVTTPPLYLLSSNLFCLGLR